MLQSVKIMYSPKRLRFIAYALAVLGIVSQTNVAMANDGFFWGAGDTLRPVHSKSLRVLRENLKLNPIESKVCYQVLFRGKPQQPPPSYDYKGSEFATIGKRLDCEAVKGAWAKFSPEWTAEATYEIEALEDAADVLFGFPVHTWHADFDDRDGLNSVPAPGVARFQTHIDSQEISATQLKWLDGIGDTGKGKTLGYTWKASFQKGKHYTLRTLYQFGIDESNAFYADHEYPKGEKPWFWKEGVWSEAHRIIYYLTPLRQWASPPPAQVSIAVTLPANLPMTLAVPIKPKPKCIGERTLFYELQDAFPTQDLELSYPVSRANSIPNTKSPSHKLETLTDWEAWMKTLGGSQVAMNCALLKRLENDSGVALQNILAGIKCQPSCQPKSSSP